ncbi:Transcription factor bHLH96 [Bienertia sinuspersici]
MALEAVVFSQDPLITNNNCFNDNSFNMNYDYFSNYYPSKLEDINCNSLKVPFNVGLFQPDNIYYSDNNNNGNSNTNSIYNFSNNNYTTTTSELLIPENDNNNNVPQWSEYQQPQYVGPMYSSPEEHVYHSGEAPPSRRKRRRRSCKNKEEVEQQRMTHIAVERNRRKQMNDYLAVIRSLMPSSYVQRGDQASIVGGAINYVKELEQLLQSIEAQKQHHHDQQPPPPPSSDGNHENNLLDGCTNSTTKIPPPATPPPAKLFADFFSFPQYSTRCNNKTNSPTRSGVSCSSTSNSVGGAEIEVTMVESHANVKILAKKQPKQLLKLIAGFQGVRLNVLHLNVTTTVDSFVLYSLSLKVKSI